MSASDEIPRRIDVQRYVPAEHAIRAAVKAVEAMPADPRLTDAVCLLAKAKDRVADFVDGVPGIPAIPAAKPAEDDHHLALRLALAYGDAERAGHDTVARWLNVALVARKTLAPLLLLAVALLTGCSATVETDNTPWGKARVATEAKPPPPIYSRSSRSTVTKPPPPAPEVEETTCENGVCGVPGR